RAPPPGLPEVVAAGPPVNERTRPPSNLSVVERSLPCMEETDEASGDGSGGGDGGSPEPWRRRRPERAGRETEPSGRSAGPARAPARQPRHPSGPARARRRPAGGHGRTHG